MAHCRYRQAGGEDASFAAESGMLRDRGHPVLSYTRDNHEIDDYGLVAKLTLPWRTVWAADSRRHLAELLRQERPDVAHFQNTFPLISPAAYSACRQGGVPVVQSLRNYRLFCPNALFFRDGCICEDCLGRNVPWSGLLHGCYRNSRAQTAAVAAMLVVHRWLGTWTEQVDIFIALTEFSRQKFMAGGLAEGQIVVKPNFLPTDPGQRDPGSVGGYFLFVGRLSPEKGINTLVKAFCRLNRVPLRVVGDGPMRPNLDKELDRQGTPNLHWLGFRRPADVFPLLKEARALIFPSECYETFGRVAVEAFACGVPVIASRLGAMRELVDDGRTGLLFTPGDSDDLAVKVEWAWTHPREMGEMGREARREYEDKYTEERNYERLMEIYRLAMDRAPRG